MECNYQKQVVIDSASAALSEGVCEHCGVRSSELAEKGEILEVCGEEFATVMESGERILTPIALCPSCHKDHHRDARGKHNPCQIKARLSCEGLA